MNESSTLKMGWMNEGMKGGTEDSRKEEEEEEEEEEERRRDR